MAQAINELDDRFWNRLIKAIDDGRVVPVVGGQLLSWQIGGSTQTLQQRIAAKLLANNDFDLNGRVLAPMQELHHAVSLLKADADINVDNLYADIADALEAECAGPDFQLPTALQQLAAISSFKLLVSLTADTLLAQALRKRVAVNEIVHSPYLPTSEAGDLPADWLKRPGEANVLYLFGKAQAAQVYAIHDEDTLEYSHNLLARGANVPARFLGELQQRSLLFLGSQFPDWLSRFLLRLTNQNRLSEKRTSAWLVNDAVSQSEFNTFLQEFSRETKLINQLPPAAFVDELYRRWQAKHTPAAEAAAGQEQNQGGDPASVAFFISYSRATDLPAAEKLFQILQEQGLTAREIWFDREAIEPGGDFQKLIFDGIKSCRYFLPLISAAADRFDEKFFYREWDAAIDRSKAIRGREFILPIILDEDYRPQAYSRVPDEWRSRIDFGHAPGGVANERTRDHLKNLIRELRRREQV
ncbi:MULTISPECIES: toll/interleukin-1 receptor domain-containing protein [Methylomonas]|uniref:toll/interleukin-1 receptor domain-containing protein n=1 Tax=Methylomonas TaxID=416 RepID=UPI001E3F8481|nr:toll/interleukin-1 receptor domain-containing protein [Methylomonas rhizoryzae]